MERVDIKAIIADRTKRRRMIIGACVALQAREGRTVDWKSMAKAYDKVRYNPKDNKVGK